MIVTPLAVTVASPGTTPSTLPPLDAAMSTITLPDFIEATISRGDQHAAPDDPGSARW